MGDDAGTPAGNTAAAITAALPAIREAHAGEIGAKDGEIARLAEALGRAEGRVDLLITQTDGLHDQLLAAEQGRADAEEAKEVARRQAHELANRVMSLEAAAERAAERDRLLADAELRLAEADQAEAEGEGPAGAAQGRATGRVK